MFIGLNNDQHLIDVCDELFIKTSQPTVVDRPLMEAFLQLFDKIFGNRYFNQRHRSNLF